MTVACDEADISCFLSCMCGGFSNGCPVQYFVGARFVLCVVHPVNCVGRADSVDVPHIAVGSVLLFTSG